MSADQLRKPRLLVLTSTFPRWKADILPPFVLQLCRKLQSAFEVHVLAPHAPGAARRETMAGLQVTRFRYFWPSFQHLAYGDGIMSNVRKNPGRCFLVPFFLAAQFLSALRYMRRWNIDVVHAHWLIPQGLVASFACPLLRKTRVGLLCTAHGSDLFALNGFFFNFLRSWIARRADRISVVSTTMAQTLSAAGVTRSKIHVIPMGIDLKHTFTPGRERTEANKILYVGRLVKQKGVSDLIRAMQRVCHRIPDAGLWIVGDGSDRRRLEGMVKTLELDGSIRFFGAVSQRELREFYRRTTVLAFPSRRAEGFGLVLVEAMGCGCPVVASDLPGIRDIVEPGRTGLVFPQGDAEKLAEQLLNLLENPKLRDQLSRKARSRVLQQYDWQIIGQKYRRLLQAAIRSVPNQERDLQR